MTEREQAVSLTPGQITYKDAKGKAHTLCFQFNPENLSRSRAVTVSDSGANETAEVSATATRSTTGRKFSLSPARWQISDLKLRFDASKAFSTTGDAGTAAPTVTTNERIDDIKQTIAHLETLVEPGAAPTENEHVYGYQKIDDPPKAVFTWGSRSFTCFVTNVTINETMFTPDLVPMRVEATVSLTLIGTVRQWKQNKTGGKN